VARLRATVSGLCQPAYVLDIPGGYGKVQVSADHLERGGVRDHAGRLHAYPDLPDEAEAARKPNFRR
jgi:lysine 2,3-aminomutase